MILPTFYEYFTEKKPNFQSCKTPKESFTDYTGSQFDYFLELRLRFKTCNINLISDNAFWSKTSLNVDEYEINWFENILILYLFTLKQIRIDSVIIAPVMQHRLNRNLI